MSDGIKKHSAEIIAWARRKEGTKVWCKRKGDKHWVLQKSPSWDPQNKYVIDDDFAETRKEHIDKEMQC